MQDILAFYREQSAVTRPGKQVALYEGLPESIEGLCKVVQGMVLHYRCGELYGCEVTAEREREIDTRYVERMLERIQKLDPRPLTELRMPAKRLVGCCRDFATLLCSILRHRGIPARTRVGFATYIDLGPDFYPDHVVVEYWDDSKQRWCMVDPQMDALLIELNRIDFDVTDMPAGAFLVGAQSWQLYRAGKANPDNFGIHPEVKEIRGTWFVRDKVLQDLATLNKEETLLWDAWGMLLTNDIGKADTKLLDTIAERVLAGDAAFDEVRQLYTQDERVRVGTSLMNYSPAVGPHEEVLVT